MGHILFILYTKDISNIAETHGLSMHMYADDTQLYISFKYRDKNNVRMTSDSIQDCLRKIRSWMGTNVSKINPGKTKFIVIGSSYNIKNDFGDELIVLNDADGKEIEKLNAVVLLGVTIDSTISMKTFINTKCSEAYYKLRNIGRLRSCLDTAMRLMLVQNLILSKLDYCNALLANTPNYLINKLQKVMNAGVRFIYNVRKHEHISLFLQKAHFLPVKQRIKHKLCMTVFKILYKLAPKYLATTICFFKPERELRVGRDEYMVESASNPNSIIGKMVVTWNQLPYTMRRNTNMLEFKKNLKTFYFNEAYHNIM